MTRDDGTAASHNGPDWHLDALCWQVAHPETFFPPKGESGNPARQVCERCTVRQECLGDAMANESGQWNRHGIYGGLGPLERQALAAAGWRPGDPAPMRDHSGRCGICGKQAVDLHRHYLAVHRGMSAA